MKDIPDKYSTGSLCTSDHVPETSTCATDRLSSISHDLHSSNSSEHEKNTLKGEEHSDHDDDLKRGEGQGVLDTVSNDADLEDPQGLAPAAAQTCPAISVSDVEADPHKREEPDELSDDSGQKRSRCRRLCSLFTLVQKGTTPPNYKYLGLMFAALFSSSFTLTFLFPFLPDMVKWMGYDEKDKGYYVGLIASSVFAGRACGSFFWGWLSDVKGRRLVLLLTIAGNGVFSLLFGFAVNLPFAMLLRFMAGLCNGTVGTAKTVLYEVSDNTNQAIGMSTIALSWGCGLIMGPTLGGYLSSPAVKYPASFSSEGFFGNYPFALSSFATLFVCFLGFLIIFFKFEETLKKKDKVVEVEDPVDVEEKKPLTNKVVLSLSQGHMSRSHQSLISAVAVSIEDIHCAAESGSFFSRSFSGSNHHLGNPKLQRSISSHATKESRSEKNNEEICHLLNESDMKKFSANQTTSGSSLNDPAKIKSSQSDLNSASVSKVNGHSLPVKQLSEVTIEADKMSESCESGDEDRSFWQSVRHSKLVSLWCVPDVRKSIMLYTVFSFGVIGSEDVFTVFLSTDPIYNGLGFSSNEIGTSLGVVAVPLLLVQLILYPPMVKRFGIKKSFIICGVILLVTVQVLPVLHLINNNRVVLWTLLLLILLPERLAFSCCFSGASLMINNSASPETAGTVNGIAMTLTAIARTLAPTVGGGVFAWSISYGAENLGPPFDHNFVFLIFGLVFLISNIQCLFLPERLNKQTKKS